VFERLYYIFLFATTRDEAWSVAPECPIGKGPGEDLRLLGMMGSIEFGTGSSRYRPTALGVAVEINVVLIPGLIEVWRNHWEGFLGELQHVRA